MLKKMRRKFILAAMTAVFTIVALLSASVYIWYWQASTRQLDMTLLSILDSERRQADPFRDGSFPGSGPFGGRSPERPYMTRYFAVTFDEDDTAQTSRKYIASISSEEAVEFGNAVLARRGDSGFYRGYRYMIFRGESSTTAVFLNAEPELVGRNALLVGSVVVSLLCMLLAFGIILILSKRAVDPYMRNIEQQKRFITDASHEIKTPLTAIAASADVLAMDLQENEWVENIRQQVQRLSKLVSNLVTLSRLDEEQPLPEQSDFVLSDVIWDVAEPIASLAAAKGKKFSQSVEDGLKMHGDPVSIGQLITLLLDNALKYSSEGGEIRLSALRQHRELVIEVYNTCHLTDPKNVNRLFDRFYRPDESRSAVTGGNGIGLSIAKAIAEAHKGSISASTTDGSDITFTIKFKSL